MEQNQHGFHNIVMILDRGLQSSALAEVLATVTSCAGYVEEMPFPIAVNAVLIRLAEAFQGEKFNPKLEQFLNVVRLSIVKAVREFRQYLHVAFSSDEIVRSVMKVSHSNDFYARSLTLMFLAALAPLVSENKKAHHLLIESLDCSEETELLAGIYAVTEFGRYSATFGALVIEKITEILCSSQTSVEVKLQLLNVISNFKESQCVTKTCFQLVNRLLRSGYNRILHIAVYDASTTFAARSSLGVCEQISLLLRELEKAVLNNNFFIQCLLTNLARLAVFSEHWQEFQILALRDMFERICESPSPRVMCAWLKCMKALTASGVYCNTVIEKDFSWIKLLKSDDLVLRISSIELIINVMKKSSVKCLHGIFLSVVSQTISDIHQSANVISKEKRKEIEIGELKFKDSVELSYCKRLFYKLISTFARMSQCSSLDALSIVKDLTYNVSLSSLLDDKNLQNNGAKLEDEDLQRIETLDLALQTLCALCDAHPVQCAKLASKWAFEEFRTLIGPFSNNNDASIINDNDVMQTVEQTSYLTTSEMPFSLFNLILVPVQRSKIISETTSKPHEAMITDFDFKMFSKIKAKQSAHNFHEFFKNLKQVSSNSCSNGEFLSSSLAAKKNEGWTFYKIGRCALRYGHWRSVALPCLEMVRESCESLETSSWINALTNIAKSQINYCDDFSVNKLNDSYKFLRNAHLIFQRLAATPRQEHCFSFAAAYTNCLALTWKAVRIVISTLNIKLITLTQFQRPFADTIAQLPISSHCIEQLCASLTMIRSFVTVANKEWSTLYYRSFDADIHTLEQIELWVQFTLVIDNILGFLCEQPIRYSKSAVIKDVCTANSKLEIIDFDTNKLVSLNTTIEPCATNYHFRTFLLLYFSVLETFQKQVVPLTSNSDPVTNSKCNNFTETVEKIEVTKTKNEVKALSNEDALRQRLTFENLKTLKEALLNLKNFPLSLPKFFFQRTFRTVIKLNILPQARDMDNCIVISTPLLPVTVEGVIQSNNSRRIEVVTVLLEMSSIQSPIKTFTDRRIIELNEGENYFKTQFLIKITEALTKINVKLLFTDSITKRNWVDESATAEMTVQLI